MGFQYADHQLKPYQKMLYLLIIQTNNTYHQMYQYAIGKTNPTHQFKQY